MKQDRIKYLFVLLLSVLVLLVFSTVSAMADDDNKAVIFDTHNEFGVEDMCPNNGGFETCDLIHIFGMDFPPDPFLMLGDMGPLEIIGACTDTMCTARIPDGTLDGSYLLTVGRLGESDDDDDDNGRTAKFEHTIGPSFPITRNGSTFDGLYRVQSGLITDQSGLDQDSTPGRVQRGTVCTDSDDIPLFGICSCGTDCSLVTSGISNFNPTFGQVCAGKGTSPSIRTEVTCLDLDGDGDGTP